MVHDDPTPTEDHSAVIRGLARATTDPANPAPSRLLSKTPTEGHEHSEAKTNRCSR